MKTNTIQRQVKIECITQFDSYIMEDEDFDSSIIKPGWVTYVVTGNGDMTDSYILPENNKYHINFTRENFKVIKPEAKEIVELVLVNSSKYNIKTLEDGYRTWALINDYAHALKNKKELIIENNFFETYFNLEDFTVVEIEVIDFKSIANI